MDSDNKTSTSSGSPSPIDVQMSSEHPMQNTISSRQRNQFSIDYILSANSAAALAAKQQQDQQTLAFVDQLTLMNQQRAQLVAAAAAAAVTNSAALSPAPVGKPGAAASHDEVDGALKLDELQRQQLAMQLQIHHHPQANSNTKVTTIVEQQQQQQTAHPNFLYFMACMLLQQQQQQALANQQQFSSSLQQQPLIGGAPAGANPTRESLAILAQLGAGSTASTLSLEQSASFGSNSLAVANNNFPHLAKPMRHAGNPYAQLVQQQQPNPNQKRTSYSPLLSSLANSHGNAQSLSAGQGHHHHNNHNHQNTHRGNNSIQQQQQHSVKLLDRSFHQRQANHATAGSQATTAAASNFSVVSQAGEKLDNLKPAHSYIGLIGMCILSSPEKRMVLNDVYQFILDHYPYYRNRGSGWRNSVRHNLSLNECFQKAGRAANGKGHYWTIHPANMEDFMNGDFRRRRAQRKVRRWNNMDVPSDESDDESMEDATRPPLPEHFKRSIEMHRRLELSFKQQHQHQVAAVAAGLNLNNMLANGSAFTPLYSAGAAASTTPTATTTTATTT